MEQIDPVIIRTKSDNCSCQFKSAPNYDEYSNIAVEMNRRVIVLFGPAGHGKGQVDAMGGWGCKQPLKKAVIKE